MKDNMTMIVIGLLGLIFIVITAMLIMDSKKAEMEKGVVDTILPYATSTDSVSTSTNQVNASSTATTTATTTNSNIKENKTMTEVKDAKGFIIKTNMGEITVMFNANTPVTKEKIATMINGGFYNGIKFHRVIKDFMIQTGDPISKDDSRVREWGTGGPGEYFKDEVFAEDVFSKGVVAMANAGPGTNGSQFFIVTAEAGTPWLAGKHTIFGRVTKGLDIADKIEAVQTTGPDRPVSPVVMESVTLIK